MSADLIKLAKQIYCHARDTDGANHDDAIQRVLNAIPVISPGTNHETAGAIAVFLEGQRCTQEGPIVMVDDSPFSQWFDPKKKDSWLRWKRYRQYLLDNKGWPFDSVAGLDASSDDIVRQLGDPLSTVGFDRRGLVVGLVQSGKTASYTALLAKAVDAGYRMAIVLTGIHNSLRHQTQVRIDEELVGVGTQLASSVKHRVGVGLLEPQDQHPPMNYLTGRGEDGDFSIEVARKVGVHIGQTPLLLVVKKNVVVLQHLISYLRGLHQSVLGPGGFRQIVNVPMLLVDDEADQASVNFRTVRNEDDELDPSLDPSRVNEQIRSLLMTFSQRTYIGYTATPFANVLIPHEGEHQTLGSDLFPRDFIVALNPPDNYIGPRQVFGTGPQADGSEQAGLPVVRFIDDHSKFIPERHRQEHVPGALPASLRKAILTYVLAGATRICRGQGKQHHTMLIHVTRYTLVQQRVAALVERLLNRLRSIMEYGSGAPGSPESRESLLAEFKALHDADFVPTSCAMTTTLPTWDDIQGNLLPGIQRIKLRVINGDVGDVLDYEQQKADGAWILAVGGDKLSRGLTLEGLCVSYYLRASRTYDTLMQMGRWFGYRPGYGDLCRIFTTADLASWFQHIVVATEELWSEFELMKRMGDTPREFGLKVKAHPSMEVTSPQKMRESQRIALNYSGTIQETIMFDMAAHYLQANQGCIDNLVSRLGDPAAREKDRGPLLWNEVSATNVIEFLRSYRTSPDAQTVIAFRMADYITDHAPRGVLATWTIAVMSAKEPSINVGSGLAGNREVYRFRRATTPASSPEHAKIRRMLSPTDELLDLTEEELRLLAGHRPGKSLLAPITAQDARGYDIGGAPHRIGRPPSRGLMILYPLVLGIAEEDLTRQSTVWGMAISFPRSSRLLDKEFVANTVWLEQMTAS